MRPCIKKSLYAILICCSLLSSSHQTILPALFTPSRLEQIKQKGSEGTDSLIRTMRQVVRLPPQMKMGGRRRARL
jgi:hypothetical protein